MNGICSRLCSALLLAALLSCDPDAFEEAGERTPSCKANDARIVASRTSQPTLLKPHDSVTRRGTTGLRRDSSSGTQGVEALYKRENPIADDYLKYVEFKPKGEQNYAGKRVYKLDSKVQIADITDLEVRVNYLGADFEAQRWTWSIYNFGDGTWVEVGNNECAVTDRWSLLMFPVEGPPSDYVDPVSRELWIGLTASAPSYAAVIDKVDEPTLGLADLDYEAVALFSAEQPDKSAVSP